MLVPLTVVAVLAAAAVLWADQQSARARLAEAELGPALARAEAAAAAAALAEASLTAIAVQRVADAAATATVVAHATEPQRALERNLGRLFAVFQDPTGPGYNQLADVFSPGALQTLRPEADYLRGRGLHLGGTSTWSKTTSPPEQVATDRTQIHTVEGGSMTSETRPTSASASSSRTATRPTCSGRTTQARQSGSWTTSSSAARTAPIVPRT